MPPPTASSAPSTASDAPSAPPAPANQSSAATGEPDPRSAFQPEDLQRYQQLKAKNAELHGLQVRGLEGSGRLPGTHG